MNQSKIKQLFALLVVVILNCGPIISCGPKPSSTPDVLVTVNDKPIGELDLVAASRSVGGHGGKENAPDRAKTLENIVMEELMVQRAVKLGLDADPQYQEDMRRLEAQINAFKRKRLSALFLQREVTGKVAVSDAEARDYFEKNKVQIRTEINVWQILKREEGQISQVLHDLEQGSSFEGVAKKQFPVLPTSQRPWDLGYLKWHQIPDAWASAVSNLKIGERSGVIRGANNRFWIIKLIDKRENPSLSFEEARPAIMEILRNKKIELLREKTFGELRKKARIAYSKGPVVMPSGK